MRRVGYHRRLLWEQTKYEAVTHNDSWQWIMERTLQALDFSVTTTEARHAPPGVLARRRDSSSSLSCSSFPRVAAPCACIATSHAYAAFFPGSKEKDHPLYYSYRNVFVVL